MVVTEGFRVFVCNTVTGKITADLPVSKVSWGVRLNGAGPVQATVPITARELRNMDIRNNTTVLKQSLGVAYNGTILECGPIWQQNYEADKETLELTAAGLWSIFDVRKALQGLAPGSAHNVGEFWGPGRNTAWIPPSNSHLHLTGSLGDIARELVRVSIQDNPFTRPDGSNVGALNVVLPPVQGGTHERNYYGFDLGWIGSRLRELSNVQNGPDIRFRPRFNGDDPTFVEWALETGTEAQPLLIQNGPDWLWDTSVAKSGVVKLGVKRDATSMAARAWAPGNGQERNMLVSWQTDTTLVDLGFPWTEADMASKATEDSADLDAIAARLLADSKAPWDQWSLQVRAGKAPRLGDYLPGDWAQVNVGPNHPMIDPGLYRVRVMAVDGDHSETVKLTVAPLQGRL